MTQRPPLINPAFPLEFQVPRFMIVLLVVTLTAATSCRRSDRPQMVPVTGTVYHNGKLLEGATVGFMGSVGRPSSGITDAQGRFRLSTWEEGDVLTENEPRCFLHFPIPGRAMCLLRSRDVTSGPLFLGHDDRPLGNSDRRGAERLHVHDDRRVKPDDPGKRRLSVLSFQAKLYTVGSG